MVVFLSVWVSFIAHYDRTENKLSELVIKIDGENRIISFTGDKRLDEILSDDIKNIIPHPCGGYGMCGKCKVDITGDISNPDKYETQAGSRLACRVILKGDACLVLNKNNELITENGSDDLKPSESPMPGRLGAAVDIGTTTIVLKVYELATGKCVGVSSRLNPQSAAAADVIGRIMAAMKGRGRNFKLQTIQVINEMVADACRNDVTLIASVDVYVITGNTSMLYLATGRNPSCLATAPFIPDYLFGEPVLNAGKTYFYPKCINAFVGADITCAILNSEMCKENRISLLCDIGTNGEMALYYNEKLFVTSTAAGPAFEGAGLSSGCLGKVGAIDKVWVENGEIKYHTISEAKATGICGSGIIDAIAAYLTLGEIDDTGAIDKECLMVAEDVVISQADIRNIQMAKAAIVSGMQILIKKAGIESADIEKVYLAGGFGSRLNIESAVKIGMLPKSFSTKTSVIGNAALTGASEILLDAGRIKEIEKFAARAVHVQLGGDPEFNKAYIDNMCYKEVEFC